MAGEGRRALSRREMRTPSGMGDAWARCVCAGPSSAPPGIHPPVGKRGLAQGQAGICTNGGSPGPRVLVLPDASVRGRPRPRPLLASLDIPPSLGLPPRLRRCVTKAEGRGPSPTARTAPLPGACERAGPSAGWDAALAWASWCLSPQCAGRRTRRYERGSAPAPRERPAQAAAKTLTVCRSTVPWLRRGTKVHSHAVADVLSECKGGQQ